MPLQESAGHKHRGEVAGVGSRVELTPLAATRDLTFF